MTLLRRPRRLLPVPVGLVLLLFLSVQIQQRTLRRRAERLSTDMQQLRLYQSTWADAQRVMKRWGKWGHYEGSCSAESCKYNIEMADLSFYSPHAPRHALVEWLLLHDHFNLYHWFGGRGAGFASSFTVRNGTIWRQSSAIAVEVSSLRPRSDNSFDEWLYLDARSRQRLHETIEDPSSFVGSDEGLARHPYYKVGRPGGCKINCQMATVNYSTHTPPVEIERLTSYQFSCFTRFKPCAELEDVLPAAKDWHLYDGQPADLLAPKPSPLPAVACDIPVWTLARDARYVLEIETLSAKNVTEDQFSREEATVRAVTSLKKPAPWLPGAVVVAYPFVGNAFDSPPQSAEHLVPGRRYIVFPIGDDRRDQRLTKKSPIRLDRCGMQEDTPKVRLELEKGFAQNDALDP